MPLYEYYCPPCGTQFEVLRPMSKMDEPAVCPGGHTTNNRVVSMFATIGRLESSMVAAPSMSNATCCGGGNCACQH